VGLSPVTDISEKRVLVTYLSIRPYPSYNQRGEMLPPILFCLGNHFALGAESQPIETLSSVWTLKATGLLFLVNLFATPLNLRAQDGAEFAPKTAHAVTVHAERGVELKAKFNGQSPVDVIER
jgi:hypothetical protein